MKRNQQTRHISSSQITLSSIRSGTVERKRHGSTAIWIKNRVTTRDSNVRSLLPSGRQCDIMVNELPPIGMQIGNKSRIERTRGHCWKYPIADVTCGTANWERVSVGIGEDGRLDVRNARTAPPEEINKEREERRWERMKKREKENGLIDEAREEEEAKERECVCARARGERTHVGLIWLLFSPSYVRYACTSHSPHSHTERRITHTLPLPLISSSSSSPCQQNQLLTLSHTHYPSTHARSETSQTAVSVLRMMTSATLTDFPQKTYLSEDWLENELKCHFIDKILLHFDLRVSFPRDDFIVQKISDMVLCNFDYNLEINLKRKSTHMKPLIKRCSLFIKIITKVLELLIQIFEE